MVLDNVARIPRSCVLDGWIYWPAKYYYNEEFQIGFLELESVISLLKINCYAKLSQVIATYYAKSYYLKIISMVKKNLAERISILLL